jgi:predicted site-specific integrase-resolvase
LIRVDTVSPKQKLYRLTEAAKRVGVSPITLKRWLIAKKVAEVRRDRNDWRVFNDADIERIRRYADSLRDPQ